MNAESHSLLSAIRRPTSSQTQTAFFLQNTRGKQDISKQYIRLYYIFGFSFLYSYLKIRLLELYTVAYLGITYLDY